MVQAVGTKGEVRVEVPSRAQRSVARRSAEARATVPDLELSVDAALPASATVTTAGLVHACARALREVPRANAAYRDGQFELYSRVNVGVVLAGDEHYVIPTLLDADRKSVAELAEELDGLSARALEGTLGAPEMSGATFTLWNPGADGIDRATPVVVPPQAAAVAAGALRALPTIREGAIVPGQTMALTLACDHRILYGSDASRFLSWIRTLIEEGTP